MAMTLEDFLNEKAGGAAMVLHAPAVISAEKGYTISTTDSPLTYRELAGYTGIDPMTLKEHLETMGAEFDSSLRFYFDMEFSAEIALSIFEGCSVKEPEKIDPKDPVLSESPSEDEPEEEVPSIKTEATAEIEKPKAEDKPVATVEKKVTKPVAVVKPVIAPDFMSYTLTTGESAETCTEIKQKLETTSATVLTEVYGNHGGLSTEDYAEFGCIEDAQKAADAINKRVAMNAAEEIEESDDPEDNEPEKESEQEPEVVPDFTDYHEKLRYEFNKIKKQFCKDADNPSSDEMNFLSQFMWYISCIDQRVAADSDFTTKVLDKRLTLDLLAKFLMTRALDLLTPTEDGNIALKEDVEAENAKKKGKSIGAKKDYTRFTTNLGDVSTKYGYAKGISLHVSDSDVAGWIADFYDHEGIVLHENIKKELEEKAKKKAEAKEKAKKKREQSKSKTRSKTTPSTSVKAEPEKEKAETGAPAKNDEPLTASEVFGKEKPYENNGGFAQMSFMDMLK